MHDVLGYSEANTLSSCERKWHYSYGLGENEQSQALFKGTALHDLIAGWETGDCEAANERFVGMVSDGTLDADTADDTAWLFDRYKRFYGGQRHRVIANELPLSAMIPGTDVLFETHGADAIVQVDAKIDPEHAGLWHLERKTMKDWQRLIVLPVDQQITTVQWLLRANGWPVRGTIFDAIRTYRFVDVKPTLAELKLAHLRYPAETLADYGDRIRGLQAEQISEAPLGDSFKRLWLTRTGDQINGQLDELRRVAHRRGDILSENGLPVRNIDRNCGWCSWKDDCWNSLITNSEVRLIDSVRARAAK